MAQLAGTMVINSPKRWCGNGAFSACAPSAASLFAATCGARVSCAGEGTKQRFVKHM